MRDSASVIVHAGVVQEVALKHTSTGVIGHSAFQEIPVTQVLKAVGTFSAGDVITEDCNDPLKTLKAIMNGATTFAFTGDATDATKVVEAAVQSTQPNDALASKAFMAAAAPCKGLLSHSCYLTSVSMLGNEPSYQLMQQGHTVSPALCDSSVMCACLHTKKCHCTFCALRVFAIQVLSPLFWE